MVRDVITEATNSLKESAPKLMIATGVIGLITAGVFACVKTRKELDKAIDISNEELNAVHKAREEQSEEEYSAKDYRKDLTEAYVHKGIRVIKVYAVPVTMAIVSATLIFAGEYKMLNKIASVTVAYEALERSSKEFRKRVDDIFGAGTSEKISLGGKPEKAPKMEDAKWEYKEDPTDIYTFVFGRIDREGRRDNLEWCDDRELLYRKLEGFQIGANDKMRSRLKTGVCGVIERPGYFYAHEMLDVLCIEPDEDGKIEIAQNCGWIYNPENPVGDNFIDIGLNNPRNINTFFEPGTDPKDRIFRKDPFNDQDVVYITLNCDGVIGPMLNPNSRFQLDLKTKKVATVTF